jgi:hypothetical protein
MLVLIFFKSYQIKSFQSQSAAKLLKKRIKERGISVFEKVKKKDTILLKYP